MDSFDSVHPDAPPTDAQSVGGGADVDLKTVTRAIYVGGAGNVKVQMLSGVDVTFTAVPVGTYLPIRVKKIYATGTSASAILALF